MFNTFAIVLVLVNSCAAAGVIQGSDSTGNGTQALPYQTIGKALTFVNGGNNRTAALCQGGSFPTTTTLTFTNTTCTAGTYCNEFREYPIGGTNSKPIVDGSGLPSTSNLFNSQQGYTNGGWRFMNLKLLGPTTNPGPDGIYLYSWNVGNYIHDILIENNDITGFQSGIGEDSIDNNITITGNHFNNNLHWGYIGAANNLNINYNSFINNGSDTTYDHAIYLATNNTNSVTNVNIIGNYMTGYSSLGTKCVGEQLVGHAAVTNFVVSGNVIVEPPNSDLQCYGMSFNGGPPNYGWFKNALFSNNIIINVGNIGMDISLCPNCLIANNLIISEGSPTQVGINSPGATAVTGYNVVENNMQMVNNTVYFGVNHTTGINAGFQISYEGTGHVIANNTVVYEATTGGMNCFKIVPTVTIAFMNNNNCYSKTGSYNWMNYNNTTYYSLASWRTYSGSDSASSYADPVWLFPTPLTIPAFDENKTGAQIFASLFKPVGLPLVGTGNATYAPATDITNTTRSATPSIGAYE